MLWYKLENKKPIATESGDWDGLKSDKVLVATRMQTMHIATMYVGTMDGSQFMDFYDDRDFEIKHVTMWAEIDNPFYSS
jgi:hypothetical protein